MARQTKIPPPPPSRLRKVQLFKEQSLGIGSYGAVCRAKCDDLICAAKILHPTLFDPGADDYDSSGECRLPIQRFEQECEFLSSIKHPNVVQYLGMYKDPDTGLPVLLMELMDSNLTQFLDRLKNVIPYHIQVNICHDIARALAFLHSNRLTHRDLSSNNVLMISDVRAKVTDLGMARLSGIKSTRTMCPGTDVYMPPEAVKDQPLYTEKIDCFSFGVIALQILTQLFPKPGNRLKTIEIAHDDFPGGAVEVRVSEVERRKNHINKVDPDHPLLMLAKKCLNDVDNERPSAHQICRYLESLKEGSEYKESISKLQQSAQSAKMEVHVIQAVQSKTEATVVGSGAGTGSGGKFRDFQDQLQQALKKGEAPKVPEKSPRVTPVPVPVPVSRDKNLGTTPVPVPVPVSREKNLGTTPTPVPVPVSREKNLGTTPVPMPVPMSREKNLGTTPFSTIDNTAEMESLKQRLEQAELEMEEKDKMIAERERQLQHMSLQCHEVTSKYINKIQELEQLPIQTIRTSTIQLRSDANPKANTMKPGVFMLQNWRECKKSPCPMARATDNAAVGCRTVYFRLSGCRQVYAYTTTNRSWIQLPDCPFEYCSLTCISNLVTTVGGFRNGCTDQLFSLTGEGSGRRWTKEFPPMPTKRSHTAALCNQVVLIVAGGRAEGQNVLRTIEVMDVDTYQWSVAADLPVPLHLALATVCSERLYVSGGRDENRHPSRSVYTCSLSTLLQSCKPAPSEVISDASLTSSPSRDQPGLWNRISDLPVTESTCVSLGGQLLAIGGMDSDNKPTTTILVHNQAANAWEIIGEMSTGRSWCFAAVLPEGKLMVVGGCTRSGIFYKSLAVTDKVEIASVV